MLKILGVFEVYKYEQWKKSTWFVLDKKLTRKIVFKPYFIEIG